MGASGAGWKDGERYDVWRRSAKGLAGQRARVVRHRTRGRRGRTCRTRMRHGGWRHRARREGRGRRRAGVRVSAVKAHGETWRCVVQELMSVLEGISYITLINIQVMRPRILEFVCVERICIRFTLLCRHTRVYNRVYGRSLPLRPSCRAPTATSSFARRRWTRRRGACSAPGRGGLGGG